MDNSIRTAWPQGMSQLVVLWLIVLLAGDVHGMTVAGAETDPAYARVTVDYLEDRAGTLGIADVATGRMRFEADGGTFLHGLGFAESTYWVRLTVPRGSPELFLEIGRFYHGYLDFYRPRPDGGHEVSLAGSRRAHTLREIDYRLPVFRMEANGERAAVYFLRVKSDGALGLPMRFLTEEQFRRVVVLDHLEFGLYFGLLGVMVLYNLFLYFGVRDRAYLWYVVSTSCFGFFMLCHNGLAAQWIWPRWESPSTYPVLLAVGAGVPAYLQFVRHLLGTYRDTPRLDFALRHTSWIALAVFAFAAMDAMKPTIYASNLLALCAMTASSIAGFVFWLRGFRPARYFVLAFLALWLAVLVTMGRSLGIPFGMDLLFAHGMQAGSAIEVVLFALALADRINLLKAEKEAAQAEALRSQGLALEAARRSEAELEQRVLERTDALARAKDEAQQANLAKTRFLAAASHDLRQPMHAIGLLVGALRERVTDAGARRVVDKIDGSVEAMDGLFNALLDISKLDSGLLQAQPAELRVQSLLDRVELAFVAEAQDKGLSLRIRKSAALVRSDPVLLDRILHNLVANAIRYTDRGGVLVGARIRGKSLRIEVWDTGVGIPQDRHGEIFQEFVQLANPTRDRTKGLGLGLSIVKRLAELLGHEVTLRSIPGRGSVFSVSVPLTGGTTAPGAVAPDPPAAVDLKGAFVLVVDDEPDILEGMCALLGQFGARVACASSGPEAVRVLREHLRSPDLIISDYRIAPDHTGIDAIRMVREAQQQDIPALLITGDSSVDDLKSVQASGLPVLFKPVSAARVRTIVIEAIAAAADRGAAPASSLDRSQSKA